MPCFSCRYWNYLRKQTFVLESYVSKVNWIMNRALFGVHFYLSWGFVCPYVMALVHIATTLRAPYSAIVKEAAESSCGQCPVSLQYSSLQMQCYCVESQYDELYLFIESSITGMLLYPIFLVTNTPTPPVVEISNVVPCSFRSETSELLVNMHSH